MQSRPSSALQVLAVVVALAAGLLLAATPALAAYPGQNGKFVYASPTCPCGLVLVDRHGSTRITSAGVFGEPGDQIVRDDEFGVISPDGQWVAFQRNEHTPDFHAAGNPGLYIVRTDGTGLRMLDANQLAAQETTRPTWSGDGTKLAYSDYPAAGEVTIVDATGAPNPRVIQATAGGADLKVAHPVWSPVDDVLAVYFVRGDQKGVGLLPVDADSASDLTPLVTSDLTAYREHSEPSWSPDGQRVAFTHRELDAVSGTGTVRIDTIKRDGTDLKALIPFPSADDDGFAGYAGHPLWSPDGNWIVWKLTVGQTAQWEGAHPDGSARNNIAVGGNEANWGPCFADCASFLPAPPDGDGDGVPDASDACPGVAGPASNHGCPVVTPPADGDGDGVPDASDACPGVAGPASNNGCPVVTPPADGDGDGVPDASDACPGVAGPASNGGCPVVIPPKDTDGDGVPDASDSCPTVAGPASNAGCRVGTKPADGDGDGVPNATDSCPTRVGPASNSGCPLGTKPADSDRDGVPNAVDSCPALVGPGANAGCPAGPGDHAGPTVLIPRSNRNIVVSKTGRLRFKLGPTHEDTTGSVALKSARKLRLGRGRARLLPLGSRSFHNAGGRRVGVTIKLPKRVMALLRRSSSLRVRAQITLRDRTGNVSSKRYAFRIRARHPH